MVRFCRISFQNSENPVKIFPLREGADLPREAINPRNTTAIQQATATPKYPAPAPHFASANPTPRAPNIPPPLIDRPR